MHANDVEIVRVYTRRVKSPVSDQTFPSNKGLEVVVDLEAGGTKHNDEGSYSINLVVRDLCDNNCIVLTQTKAGNFGDETWSKLDLSLPFAMKPQGSKKENHIYEALACLTAGKKNPDVSFVRSNLFCITKP